MTGVYGALGALEIRRADGEQLELPCGHALNVLAALLVNANQRMSKEDLLRAAWGNSHTHEAQLHKAVTQLRGLLAQIGRAGDLVTHHRQGYEIRVPDEALDTLRFRQFIRLADEASAQRRSGDEIEHLRAALRLWRGPRPLANVPGDAFRREIDLLRQRRKRVAVRLFDLEIARGRYEMIVNELTEIASDAPTDRRLCEQLMIVLYRCGHPLDALRAYDTYVEAIDEAIGGSPEKVLRDLRYAIAGADDSVVAAMEHEIAKRVREVSGAAAALPKQLPPRPAHFVGRDDLAAEASRVLGRRLERLTPVVVVSGSSGIGKTALALRIAHETADNYPDGQLYVQLHGTTPAPTEPSEALAQCLRGFGVTDVPETRAERAALYRTLLADRRTLVFLDDAVDGAQVADLIPASPGCGVLITARRRLPELAGVHHLPQLQPLDDGCATTLLLSVIAADGIDVVRRPEVVADLVARCNGLPRELRNVGARWVHDDSRRGAEPKHRLDPERSRWAGVVTASQGPSEPTPISMRSGAVPV